jgi:hypothetical protein
MAGSVLVLKTLFQENCANLYFRRYDAGASVLTEMLIGSWLENCLETFRSASLAPKIDGFLNFGSVASVNGGTQTLDFVLDTQFPAFDVGYFRIIARGR